MNPATCWSLVRRSTSWAIPTPSVARFLLILFASLPSCCVVANWAIPTPSVTRVLLILFASLPSCCVVANWAIPTPSVALVLLILFASLPSCCVVASLLILFASLPSWCVVTSALLSGPRGLTFTWWGCYGLCQRHKATELANSFLFCSCVYFSVCGPFNCISFRKFSRQISVFLLFSSGLTSALWSFQLYICLWKSPSAQI